jgi:hypothetical protein
MKKILCFAALLGLINHSFAQNNSNPWPTTGNVGIGTTSPGSSLDISSALVANGATALNVVASGSATNATYYGQKINVSHTSVGGGGGAIGLDLAVNRSGTGIFPTIGINGIVNTGARASSASTVNFYGSKFIVNGSTATTSTASGQNYYGTYGEVADNTAVGEASNSYGLYGKASSISTAYGVYGAATGVTGTTDYGGYFTATGGTTNYGVYSAAGTNYFNNNVGIGTTTPGLKAHITGAIGLPATTGTTQTGVLRLQGLTSNAVLDFGVNGGSGAYLQVTNQTALNANYPLLLNPNGGNVGIGITNPTDKLAVNGTIHTKEVRVDLTGWPDYVFKKDYKLPTLIEVKDYIDKNQHLPDMPSEKEVADNGLNLGEMNKILTKKVEELTLYLIEQNKRIEKLESVLKKSSAH